MKLGFTTFLSIYDDLLDLMCLWNPASAFSVPFYPTYGTILITRLMGHFAPARLGNRAYRGTAEVSIYFYTTIN